VLVEETRLHQGDAPAGLHLAGAAGAPEHVEKLARGQHDAAGAAADELHPVYVLHDHEAGGEVDPRRESGRA